MSFPWVTVTPAVVSARPGSALAWIVADPVATPVTGTVTLLAPDAKVTVGGTVATAMLLELRLIMTPPDGAGTDRFSVKFCVAVPMIVPVGGEKASVAVTSTGRLAGV
jgi:hypothetical protein